MNGQVYRVPIQGHSQNFPHPHVVLIELDKECWLIPAFGDDGPEVQCLISAHDKMGFNSADVAVHMDNGQYVTYVQGYSGIKAYWVIARAFKATKAFLKAYDCIGQMNEAGLLMLAQATQRLALSKPDFISPSLQKKVRKMIETLTSTTPLPPDTMPSADSAGQAPLS